MAEAIIGLVLGAGMIAAGIVLAVIGLAVAGFVVMLLCGIWALNNWRQMSVALGTAQRGQAGGQAGGRRSRRSRRGGSPHASFGERLDERWRRRQEGGR